MIPLVQPTSSGLLQALEDLDKGIVSHTNWLKMLHRALICDDEKADEKDIQPNAHCNCNFGQWYYSGKHPELDEMEIFAEIGRQHQAMHDNAREILLKSDREEPIVFEDYDSFISLAIDFKLEIRKLQQQIIDQVCVVDHLTGAWNRQSMTSRLTQEYERVVRSGNSCSICMLDIDHFKQVNDTHGHAGGDQVLKGIIDRCVKELRAYDSIFRYGGEEFLLCLPDINPAAAHPLIERLRITIEESPFELNNGNSVKVTASFGIAHITPEKTLEDVIVEADHALLYAKSQGRNCICTWNT
ncbi:hypothetical protein BOW53_13820 [Solemya pervernicosa gill symbiont]|uniref:diguanylate cyclase n=2 Tax=Gammaproteobacteria incertae sedis TaxID=118884 RepID=A0A1T2L190_9GAMM|nr:diguanylate cyclase [Candidatus Reidiella endopervernicosa]OOZ38867.1 hypothetical protein BOW53_13820 [Solemya pervernicosa gill symbiont]QKQ25138.1 diguanylate cyclase [Candidatus Reidiella endopervernicosa]